MLGSSQLTPHPPMSPGSYRKQQHCMSISLFQDTKNSVNCKNGVSPVPYTSFWDAAKASKEGDVLECAYNGYQNIVNNGEYMFFWEQTEETVTLSGEFLGMMWRIKTL